MQAAWIQPWIIKYSIESAETEMSYRISKFNVVVTLRYMAEHNTEYSIAHKAWMCIYSGQNNGAYRDTAGTKRRYNAMQVV